jgi:hypothetical protein
LKEVHFLNLFTKKILKNECYVQKYTHINEI